MLAPAPHRFALAHPAPLAWILDPADLSPRLHSLREIFDRPENDPDVLEARAQLLATPVVQQAFAAQREDGTWGDLTREDEPRGTAWMLSWLLQLGVPPRDPRLVKAARTLVNARQVTVDPRKPDLPDGAFSFSPDPADAASCVTGDDLALALSVLGPIEENRRAVLWLLRNQRHDGGWLHCHRWHWRTRARRMLSSRKLGWSEETDPAVRSCRFGTYRAMRALTTLAEELRDDLVRKALTRGAEYFLARGVTGTLDAPEKDLVPNAKAFNAGLQLLGTPVRQTTDMLAIARILTDLGYGTDARLAPTLTRIRALQQADGSWLCDSAGPGMWPTDDQRVGLPSKRVTIDAIALLKRVARSTGAELDLLVG